MLSNENPEIAWQRMQQMPKLADKFAPIEIHGKTPQQVITSRLQHADPAGTGFTNLMRSWYVAQVDLCTSICLSRFSMCWRCICTSASYDDNHPPYFEELSFCFVSHSRYLLGNWLAILKHAKDYGCSLKKLHDIIRTFGLCNNTGYASLCGSNFVGLRIHVEALYLLSRHCTCAAIKELRVARKFFELCMKYKGLVMFSKKWDVCSPTLSTMAIVIAFVRWHRFPCLCR